MRERIGLHAIVLIGAVIDINIWVGLSFEARTCPPRATIFDKVERAHCFATQLCPLVQLNASDAMVERDAPLDYFDAEKDSK